MKIMYGAKDMSTSLSILRYVVFRGKKKLDMKSLPPTEEATRQHSYRVYAQIQMWLGRSPNISDWGWRKEEFGFVPITTIAEPIPPSLLKKLFCACKSSENGCGNRCGCRKLGRYFDRL